MKKNILELNNFQKLKNDMLSLFNQIEQKANFGRMQRLKQWDLKGSEINLFKENFCKILAKKVSLNEWQFSAVKKITVYKDKARIVHQFCLGDFILAKFLQKKLAPLLETFWPETLHSYRKGKSQYTAISYLFQYLKKHRKNLPKKNWGLFIYKTDISQYGLSVPTYNESQLWTLIKKYLPLCETEFDLVKKC